MSDDRPRWWSDALGVVVFALLIAVVGLLGAWCEAGGGQ